MWYDVKYISCILEQPSNGNIQKSNCSIGFRDRLFEWALIAGASLLQSLRTQNWSSTPNVSIPRSNPLRGVNARLYSCTSKSSIAKSLLVQSLASIIVGSKLECSCF